MIKILSDEKLNEDALLRELNFDWKEFFHQGIVIKNRWNLSNSEDLFHYGEELYSILKGN